jgi:hypothetical protein
LIPALASALASGVTEPDDREAAVITFVVTAAGLSIVGVGSAFWGLLAGILALSLRRRSQPSTEDDRRSVWSAATGHRAGAGDPSKNLHRRRRLRGSDSQRGGVQE